MRIFFLSFLFAVQLSAYQDDPFYSILREVLRSDYGFTLLGAKPLSFEDFHRGRLGEDESGRKIFIFKMAKLFEGSSRFMLKIKEKNGTILGAFLIDRKAFERISASLDEISFETVKIGELFGYGKKNAEFYMRYRQLGIYLKKIPLVWLVPRPPRGIEDVLPTIYPTGGFRLPFKLQLPEPNSQYTSLEDEWIWIRNKRRPNTYTQPPFWIQKPCFVSRQDRETDEILRKFDSTASQLGTLLHSDHWFEEVQKIIQDK